MNKIVTVNFVEGDGQTRPDDASLTNDLIEINSISDIPQVNDFVEFDEGTGEQGLYQVISRLFFYMKDHNQTTIAVNCVVKKMDDILRQKLIKE